MKNLYKSLFLNNRFFYFLGGISLLFVLGFFVPLFFEIAKIALFVLSILTIVDAFLLYKTKEGIAINRSIPERLSNGDDNKISLVFFNNYSFLANLSIIEELPFQFQKRDFIFQLKIKKKTTNPYFITSLQKNEASMILVW